VQLPVSCATNLPKIPLLPSRLCLGSCARVV